MNILFMAQCYAPEEVSAAVLITELATDLVARGHHVEFVTGAPSYPYGRVFAGYRNRLFQQEWLDGVRVIRTWSYISPRKTIGPRLLHYGSYSTTALYGGLLAARPEIVVSYSPPLPLGLSAWLLSRRWRVPWVLQIEDLYPDAAVAAGVLHNRQVIAFFAALERSLYRRATHISVIAKTFRQRLLEKGVAAEKISLIPVWADPDAVRPLPKDNEFRRSYGLTGKFVVMYAGNFGLTSCLEEVLGAAQILADDTSIRFVLIGEGIKKPVLEELVSRQRLPNVLLLPYQPRSAFAETLAAADISLVTLNQRSALASLPSKVFNVMASARPILALAPPDSELGQLVADADCGVTVPPEKPQQLADTLLALKARPEALAQMGQKGRTQLEREYSRSRCCDMYEHMLGELVSTHVRVGGVDLLARRV
jgi:colanic acid biosynthesis glycosyl transferase WcaI